MLALHTVIDQCAWRHGSVNTGYPVNTGAAVLESSLVSSPLPLSSVGTNECCSRSLV